MLSTQDKIDRVTAILEGDKRLIARLDMAEAISELIDRAAFSMITAEQAIVDRVTDILCPPPPPDDLMDTARYFYGPLKMDFAKAGASDFGVIRMNCVA